MRELKLKYILDLVSNIGQRARDDAQRVREAQEAMRREVKKTEEQIDQQGAAVTRTTTATVRGATRQKSAQDEVTKAAKDTEKQLDHTGAVGQRSMDQVGRAARTAQVEIGRMVPALQQADRIGSQTMQRQLGYLERLARGWGAVRSAASGAAQVTQKMAQGGLAVAAGTAAGAAAADRVTKAPMEYSLRLAHMANTAFADKDVAGRLQGKRILDAAIGAAVRTGGGTRDDAAGALDALIASGALGEGPEGINKAVKLLPMLTRASTASGASAEQLGSIALRGMQSFGLDLGQIPEALNMAMAAGQAGGFELRDMARWLPQLMAMGKQSGLSGMEGMRRILASAQASVITAGTKDEAGNNLVNLLGKINSHDTANDFKKLGYDLPAELARMRGKGVNSLDAFVSFVDEIASKDQQYVALKRKLATAGTSGEKAATMQSMADILQGKAVGKVIQDRQALMALVAEMNNRTYIKGVMQQTRENTGAIGTSFDVISQETGFKRQQAMNEAAMAGQTAFEKVAPVMDRIFETGTGVARQFPILTAVTIGLISAFGVLAAAVGAGGLAGLLTGRGAGAAAAASGAAGRLAGGLAARGGVAAAGAFAGYELWQLGSAAVDLYKAKTREGVTLTPEARERLAAMNRQQTVGAPTLPALPDYLALTGPGAASQVLAGGAGAGGVAALRGGGLGQGQLDVMVRVSDERVSATSQVAKPLSVVRINPGNTNPAGYR